MRVGFSLRDERGQGVIEYVLVLVVAVSIILGGIYQLNSAFKAWAESYFGDYLSCLLETGELPTISGSPGDSGICNEFFKPFSLADGRPLNQSGQSANSKNSSNSSKSDSSGGGMRESQRSGAGGGAGNYTRVGSFGSYTGQGRANLGGSRRGSTDKMDSSYTGSTEASNYSLGNSSGSRRTQIGLRTTLDNRFAFDEERERQQRRQIASTTAKVGGTQGSSKTAIRLNDKGLNQNSGEAPSSGFTIGDFLRYLIIAAIIIALVVFLGGQGLQIGKSMDGGS